MADWDGPTSRTRLRLSFRSSSTEGGAVDRCITVTGVAAVAVAASGPC
ncbi:hypothetical protein HMPREF1550_01357 [Actinomyces sp. oral taxon 877 str. F0543]|nr:hypothetical protein HMPREF1550_01357 [Actinomyces sp. oral taxon 877 str. F0543]